MDIVAICAAIITVSGALTAIGNWIAKAKEPNKKQNDRLTGLESRMTSVEERLERGDKRFDKQDDDTKIIMQSMLALMKHAINGNDIEMLRDMQKKLDEYLITHRE